MSPLADSLSKNTFVFFSEPPSNILLQSPELAYSANKFNCVPLSVTLYEANGRLVMNPHEIIHLMPGREGHEKEPSLSLDTGVGTVCYRLCRVTKREDTSRYVVRVAVKGHEDTIQNVRSGPTAVLSKRKNKAVR